METGNAIVGQPERVDRVTEIGRWLMAPGSIKQIQQADRTGTPPTLIVRLAMAQVRSNTALARCTPSSIHRAICEAIGLGLEPDGARGLAFLIPYANICRLQPGYKGLVQLAYRSGQIAAIMTQAVYAKDHFRLSLGTDPKIDHVPSDDVDRGPFRGAYATARVNGAIVFEYMTKADIEKIRGMSQAVKKGKTDSPWFTHYDMMARKTVFIRLSKMLPSSPELQRAIAVDEAVEGLRPDVEVYFPPDSDQEFIDQPPQVVDDQGSEIGELDPPANKTVKPDSTLDDAKARARDAYAKLVAIDDNDKSAKGLMAACSIPTMGELAASTDLDAINRLTESINTTVMERHQEKADAQNKARAAQTTKTGGRKKGELFDNPPQQGAVEAPSR